MASPEEFEINLNGTRRIVRANPDMPLLHVLRDLLGAREARFGCGDGLCGACTVIMDGHAVTSCDLPVASVRGPVETSASLAAPGGDHPILAALLDHNAGQCGFCLPGIAMRAKAFLRMHPDATREEIAAALDGNLCRCGAQKRILDSLCDVAERIAERS